MSIRKSDYLVVKLLCYKYKNLNIKFSIEFSILWWLYYNGT